MEKLLTRRQRGFGGLGARCRKAVDDALSRGNKVKKPF